MRPAVGDNSRSATIPNRMAVGESSDWETMLDGSSCAKIGRLLLSDLEDLSNAASQELYLCLQALANCIDFAAPSWAYFSFPRAWLTAHVAAMWRRRCRSRSTQDNHWHALEADLPPSFRVSRVNNITAQRRSSAVEQNRANAHWGLVFFGKGNLKRDCPLAPSQEKDYPKLRKKRLKHTDSLRAYTSTKILFAETMKEGRNEGTYDGAARAYVKAIAGLPMKPEDLIFNIITSQESNSIGVVETG